ncbi:hypothetical protein RJ640_003304 [Escallonia rubra]|uniref:Remorin C-terminal domain-containing protein n=1 Tax=Escallonia rubra TaxID=112253 RepID=A0AA88U6A9_9ASTE|nr:hypothetical protein RJ640_003304 [Escallonia rubra]
MNQDYDSINSEFATAIAAATFAIHSVEEGRVREEGFRLPVTRARTSKERVPESSGVSRRLSRKETKEAAEASTRKPLGQGDRAPSSIRPARSRRVETKADAWEKAEIAKIQSRYEKINSAILAWENEKKASAKRQMELKKSDLEQRRARNSQHYQGKLARINHIAGGARGQAEEKKRHEGSMAKKKAQKIRSTGNVPVCCFCF